MCDNDAMTPHTGEHSSPLRRRKANRLKDYDYSQAGAYFVTICTKDHAHLFGSISRGELCSPVCQTHLSPIGEIVESEIEKLSATYDMAYVNLYVIMPNHVHMIIVIRHNNGRTQFAPTLSRIIKQWKGAITKRIGRPIWQKSFYDRIIRNEGDYLRIAEYIETNPAKWQEDEYYS